VHAQNPPCYNKFLLDLVNYPSPSCKDCPDFSRQLLLRLLNCPLNKEIRALEISDWSPPHACGVSFWLYSFSFNKTWLLLCNLSLCNSLFERHKNLRSFPPGSLETTYWYSATQAIMRAMDSPCQTKCHEEVEPVSLLLELSYLMRLIC
jgi:hypothetical protein